jgi:hypothetical protein
MHWYAPDVLQSPDHIANPMGGVSTLSECGLWNLSDKQLKDPEKFVDSECDEAALKCLTYAPDMMLMFKCKA